MRESNEGTGMEEGEKDKVEEDRQLVQATSSW